MKAYHIEGTVFVIDNEDGTWSMTDNGEEQDGLSYNQAMKYALEEVVTQEDVESWDSLGMSAHLQTVWNRFPQALHFQIWGSRDGKEPLTISV